MPATLARIFFVALEEQGVLEMQEEQGVLEMREEQGVGGM
jgi:hypothetical protein